MVGGNELLKENPNNLNVKRNLQLLMNKVFVYSYAIGHEIRLINIILAKEKLRFVKYSKWLLVSKTGATNGEVNWLGSALTSRDAAMSP